MKSNYWTIILGLGVVVLLIFSYQWQNKGSDANELPKYALRTAEVRAAYEYALENPGLLENMPCYCDCNGLGHEHVRHCFIKEFKGDGRVVFDEHGANCGICYSTVLDSKTLLEKGETIREIRDFIDNKYSQYGQGTKTPLQ